jgi:hypothetical protein
MDEITDVIDFNKKTVNFIEVYPFSSTSIYVDKQFYDSDLILGFNTEEDALKQMKKDVPRSEFHYNGIRYKFVPNSLPRNMAPYCTQAVMGLPVCLLSTHVGLVCESGKPLIIHVYTFTKQFISVQKELYIKATGFTISVNVLIVITHDLVVIKFIFGDFEKSSSTRTQHLH